MYGMTSRYSCYECPFARIPRQGDITLADYWGVKEFFPEMDDSKGVSMILVNSSNGQKVWNAVKVDNIFEKSRKEAAAKCNGNLIGPTSMPIIRTRAYKEVLSRGYVDVASKDFRCSNYFKTKVKQYLLHSFMRPAIIRFKSIISSM
jgi:hypothetical protein